uniref:Uncharacterized protein n=1 Tax=Oryza glumipatula TaxID=40148 RepID=A0A0E0BUP1_9ORYZ
MSMQRKKEGVEKEREKEKGLNRDARLATVSQSEGARPPVVRRAAATSEGGEAYAAAATRPQPVLPDEAPSSTALFLDPVPRLRVLPRAVVRAGASLRSGCVEVRLQNLVSDGTAAFAPLQFVLCRSSQKRIAQSFNPCR